MCSRVPEPDPACDGMLRELFAQSVKAMDPGPLVERELERAPIPEADITLLALGKSAVPMASAALSVLSERVVEQCVVAPQIPKGMPDSWLASSHPTPTERSVHAAQALLRAAGRAKGEILFLLSGGGSSLAALPAPGLTLAAKVDLVNRVYAAGVAIEELNIVRKQLSAFKGGGLAAVAKVPITTLLVSDVIGDVLDVISSGPALPDSSTAADALAIACANLENCEGPAVAFLRHRAGAVPTETDPALHTKDRHTLLAGIAALAQEAHRRARAQGLTCHLIGGEVQGGIESVASLLLRSASKPGLWIAGGEATVRVVDSPGQGGRAQQLALYLAREISGSEPMHVLVAGSDGLDGNSQAAGAVVDNTSYERLLYLGIDPEDALRRCDAASALAALDAQIITGPTSVNHADLMLVYRPHQESGDF